MIKIGKAELHNCDCMELMKQYPDKYFDLAIADPPYGINAGNKTYGKRIDKHQKKSWDLEIPNKEYFDELMRVSKNQIIWGGNYFPLPLTGGWLFWDKEKGKETTFSDGELAWTSFLSTLKKISVRYDGFIGMDIERIHPTQKPVKLYETLLTKYANKGDKILDTHLGSMSSVIACLNLGYEIVGSELDKDYFDAGVKRVEQSQKQIRMFE